MYFQTSENIYRVYYNLSTLSEYNWVVEYPMQFINVATFENYSIVLTLLEYDNSLAFIAFYVEPCIMVAPMNA